jgi:hypothetical protein
MYKRISSRPQRILILGWTILLLMLGSFALEQGRLYAQVFGAAQEDLPQDLPAQQLEQWLKDSEGQGETGQAGLEFLDKNQEPEHSTPPCWQEASDWDFSLFLAQPQGLRHFYNNNPVLALHSATGIQLGAADAQPKYILFCSLVFYA